jgi:hypothetical protein
MPPHVIEPDTGDPDLSNVPVRTTALVLHLVEMALHDEGLSQDVITSVRNRLLYGHPDGAAAVVRLDPDTGRTVMRP